MISVDFLRQHFRAGLWNQVTDSDKLRFATHVSAAKFITSRKCCNQPKALIEFVPDTATRRGNALRDRESNAAPFYRGLRGPIELEHRFIYTRA
jgi:hypothetical protein